MLRIRIATALVLGGSFCVLLFAATPDLFALGIAIFVAAAAWEWGRLAGVSTDGGEVVYACVVGLLTLVCLYVPASSGWLRWALLGGFLFWLVVPALFALRPTLPSIVALDRSSLVLGAAVLMITAVAMQYLRNSAPLGSAWLLLYALSIVWLMDIGAFFSGRRFGRRKLSPLISPGKSWEGVYGGVAVTMGALVLVLLIAPLPEGHMLKLVVATMLAAAASVIGDLYESRIKRGAGAKDSSQLLPGHGGMLDRVDGVLAAIPVFAFVWAWT